MTTGSQGEPMSGLTRMSNRDHRNITIEPGDTVIISASPIPGNEEAVAKTIDNLFKEGAMVHYEPLKHCHVSGHGVAGGAEADARPREARHFIPVHGEYRMLVQHGLLAEGAGVPVDGIFVLENGQVVEFDGTRAGSPAACTAGAVLVDGIAAIDGVDGVILRDRRALASRRRGDGRADGRPRDRAARSPGPTSSGAASCPTPTTRSWRRPASTCRGAAPAASATTTPPRPAT